MTKGARFNDEVAESNDFWDETARREDAEAEALENEASGGEFDDINAETEQAEQFVEDYEELAELESTIGYEREAPEGEDWFQQAAREAREMAPAIREEMGYPAETEDDPPRVPITEETLDAGFFAEPSPAVIDEIAQSQALALEQPEQGIAEAESQDGQDLDAPDDLDAILSQVDDAMAEAERPIELTDDQLAKGEQVAKLTAIFELFTRSKGFSKKINSRQVVSSEFQEAAEAGMLTASKRMVVCPELKAIRDCVRTFKGQLKYLQCPTDLLRGGMALIPLRNVDQVEELYRAFKPDHHKAVKAFLTVYLMMQQRDRRVQGPLYNSRDYPPLRDVARCFGVDRRWLAFDAPAATEEIKAVAFREASAQVRAQVAEAGVEMIGNLQGQAMGWIEWFVGQLEVGEDGKRKSIADAKFADMQKFFEMAGALNVTGNEEFNTVIEMGQAALAGRDVAEFKANGKQRATADQLREDTARAFEGIKAQTAGWVVNQPVRPVYSLEDV